MAGGTVLHHHSRVVVLVMASIPREPVMKITSINFVIIFLHSIP